jgi:hypothetical protein
MFIYHRNVSASIVAIIRKRNNDALTNNIYSFFLKYIRTDRQRDRHTDRHTFAFIYKKIISILLLLLYKLLQEVREQNS